MARIITGAEIVVQAFLEDKIGFLQMSEVIEQCIQSVAFIAKPKLEDYIKSDKEARFITKKIIDSL